jgi:hypothetical protein
LEGFGGPGVDRGGPMRWEIGLKVCSRVVLLLARSGGSVET